MLRHLAKASWKPQGVGLRWCASVTEGENKLMDILKQKLEADPVIVKDVSGMKPAMPLVSIAFPYIACNGSQAAVAQCIRS